MPLPPDYPALLGLLDRWHEEVRERHPGIIPCRPGCSACCHGPFDISMADALLVRDTVASLPPNIQAALTDCARAQAARMAEFDPGFGAPWNLSGLDDARVDALVNGFEDDPCPALDEAGQCQIYTGRPMICRLMGLGIENAAGEVIDNACPIIEDFPAYEALGPQPFDLDLWEESEALAKTNAAVVFFGTSSQADFETTVAGAILLGTSQGT